MNVHRRESERDSYTYRIIDQFCNVPPANKQRSITACLCVAGKWTYLTYGKLMTGLAAALGAQLSHGPGTSVEEEAAAAKKSDDGGETSLTAGGPIWTRPSVVLMLFGVACAEGFYM